MVKAFAAAVVSVAWNFLGSRYFAFRHTAVKRSRTMADSAGVAGEATLPEALRRLGSPSSSPSTTKPSAWPTEVAGPGGRDGGPRGRLRADPGRERQLATTPRPSPRGWPRPTRAVRALRVPVPDYGAAMKAGMLAGRGDLIVNFDIDFHDVDFMLKAGECCRERRGRSGGRPPRRRLRRAAPPASWWAAS